MTPKFPHVLGNIRYVLKQCTGSLVLQEDETCLQPWTKYLPNLTDMALWSVNYLGPFIAHVKMGL